MLERLEADRADWLRSRGIDPADPNWQSRLQQLSRECQIEFFRTFNAEFHRLLDSGYGECVLRNPEAGNVVASSLKYFDGRRYHLSDFVVMPNHVHVLFGLIGEMRLSEVCYSWKKYTAGQINKLFGRSGHFWQGESFDHIVRSAEQFEHFQNYIVSNPEKANLKAGEFVLYSAARSTART